MIVSLLGLIEGLQLQQASVLLSVSVMLQRIR